MSKIPVDDNHNEVLRKSAQDSNDGTKYDLRTITVAGGGSIIDGISFDTVNVTYPTSTTEVFTYLLSSVTQATVTVTYSDASKKNITSVART